MNTLSDSKITLRALEPEDLDFLFTSENNEYLWKYSNTKTPFSKFILKNYIENSHLDIFEAKQLRLIIEENISKKQVGMIDLFDFDPHHKRAGIGIFINEFFQKKGYASRSLSILIKYCFSHLDLHQLFANIGEENKKSINLFSKHNFKKIGTKKDWNFSNGKFTNETLWQLIHEK